MYYAVHHCHRSKCSFVFKRLPAEVRKHETNATSASRIVYEVRDTTSINLARSTCKIACLCYHCHSSTAPSYVADMQHNKQSHSRSTRSSTYTMPLLNRPAHSKAVLVIARFLLLHLLNGTLFQMMPDVPHHCYHLSRLKTYLFLSVYRD